MVSETDPTTTFLSGYVSATGDCPQNEEQNDRAEERHQDRSKHATERQAKHSGDKASNKRAEDTDDQVTENTAGAFARDDHFRQETCDNADDDPE